MVIIGMDRLHPTPVLTVHHCNPTKQTDIMATNTQGLCLIQAILLEMLEVTRGHQIQQSRNTTIMMIIIARLMLIRALITPTGGLILIMKGLTNLLPRAGIILDMVDIMHQGCSKMVDTPTTQVPHNINTHT